MKTEEEKDIMLSQQKKERSSNIELYRIFVMLLIVAHHYVVHSGLIQVINEDPLSSNSQFYFILGAWGKTGINCFVLITGYFMCKQKISLRKFLKLFIWVFFYCILISGIFIAVGYHPTGNSFDLIKNGVPMRTLSDGFSSCFLVFFLCIPYLNILVHNITQKQHLLLICILLFIYTLHTLPGFSVTMNYVSWFSVLYIIASYLRIYPLSKDKNTAFWGWMTLLSWSMSILSILTLLRLNEIGASCWQYMLLSDSNTILALTNGITSFMWFKNLNIKNSKFINTIAASSFGVLLIHDNSSTMSHWLWEDVFDGGGHYNTPYYWAYSFASIFLTYAVCTVIDIIRIKTIETPLLNITEKFCVKTYKEYIS